jgi:adenosine kinase
MTMAGRVMISGSVAYDTIMVFDGHFKDHILADQVHMLNVSFLAPRLKREFGGCAANIAYSLRKLGGDPLVLAAIGRDGNDYLERMRSFGIDTARVRAFSDQYTAQAFITTDLSDNQITAFHPGAMGSADQVSAQADGEPVAWGIVAPNGKAAMLQHAGEFAAQGIPFIFDPGQGLPMFDGQELRELITSATALTVNDYEAKLICERTGWSESEIAGKVQALVITRGAEGSTLYEGATQQTIAAVSISRAVDPTGCGDAYRAGLLYGLSLGWTWLDSARLGSVLGAAKIEHAGAQNHPVDRAQLSARFAAAYGHAPW